MGDRWEFTNCISFAAVDLNDLIPVDSMTRKLDEMVSRPSSLSGFVCLDVFLLSIGRRRSSRPIVYPHWNFTLTSRLEISRPPSWLNHEPSSLSCNWNLQLCDEEFNDSS